MQLFIDFFGKYAILFIKKENIFQIRKKHVCVICRPGNKEISCSLYRGLNNPINDWVAFCHPFLLENINNE